MKLRNKRTGEIADVEISINCILVAHQDGRIEQYYFDSIKDLLEWEDYKPAEPLIKDEKIRKAVRAWADENIIHQVEFEYIAGTGSIFKDGICGVEIGFYDDLKLTNRETYTIDELCGEEEE